MKVRQGRIFVGTSGWSYGHWREVFYPRALPAREYLRFYASHFATVEINSSFYHLPTAGTVTRWLQETPDHFCFALKASRYLTHRLRLRDADQSLQAFLQVAGLFGPKLGPLLFQLPPSLHRDDALLADFLAHLPRDRRVAFEFRHRSWYDDAVLALLSAAGVALCVHDFRGCETPPALCSRLTASFAYVRFHGPQSPYTGSYDHGAPCRLGRPARGLVGRGP
jgi:uncharacterized protein YecE (DUF72 family)